MARAEYQHHTSKGAAPKASTFTISSSYEEPPPLTLPNRMKHSNATSKPSHDGFAQTRDHRSDHEEMYKMSTNRMASSSAPPPPPPPPPPGRPMTRPRDRSNLIREDDPSIHSRDNSFHTEVLRYGGVDDRARESVAERRRRKALEVSKKAEMKFDIHFASQKNKGLNESVDYDPPLELDITDSDDGSEGDRSSPGRKKKKSFFKVKSLIRKGQGNEPDKNQNHSQKKGLFRGLSPAKKHDDGKVFTDQNRSAEIVVNRAKLADHERKMNELAVKEESKFEKLRREREEKRAEEESKRKDRSSAANPVTSTDFNILNTASDDISGVTDPSYATGFKPEKKKSNLESVHEVASDRQNITTTEWRPQDFKTTIGAYSRDVFEDPFFLDPNQNKAPKQMYSFAYSESDGELENNIITSKDTMNGLSFEFTDDEKDALDFEPEFGNVNRFKIQTRDRDAFLGFDETSGAVTVNAGNVASNIHQDNKNGGILAKRALDRRAKSDDQDQKMDVKLKKSQSKHIVNSSTNNVSKSKSDSFIPPSSKRSTPRNTPSFIHERRERRHIGHSLIEESPKLAFDLARGKSDVNVAVERGRRRDLLFESISEKMPNSPSGRSFSPSKVRRSLVDEPVHALTSMPIRSQTTKPPRELTRYDSRTANSWFSKPQFTYRPLQTLAKTAPGSMKRANSFKAPDIFTSGTAGPFKAPTQFSMKSDPVLRSVAHIQDPIQRAGAMILSAAAIPIQTEIRRYLGVKHREDRFWAIIVVQSYFRRWKAELYRYKYLYCATRIQAAFRGWLCRDTLEDKHYCATLIQKIARGYIATMQVYEDLYNITVVQSLVRRNLAIKAAEERYRSIIRIQSIWRARQVRLEMAYLAWNAVRIQTAYRRYTAKLNYQFTIVDVIIVQSIARKKAAQKRVVRVREERIQNAAITIQKYWRCYDCTMNYLHTVADILIAQSVARRWLAYRYVEEYRYIREQEMALKIQLAFRASVARDRVRKERSARDIQKVWRGYVAYTNMLFSLVHIIICQSVIRRHLQIKRFKVDIVEHRSAIKIQKVARVFLTKRLFLHDFCATIIQRKVRQFHAKKFVEKMLAARTIQAWYRCQSTSRGYKYYTSARRIQTIWRGYDARRLADEERWIREYAATTIQKTWRMYYSYSTYEISKHENRAATNIQRTWRGFWDYSHFLIMRYEACRIQSVVRGMIIRNRLARKKSAAVLIQSAARMLLAKKLYHMERLYLAIIHGAESSLTYKIASRKIQTKFRSISERTKEKRAALVIERFFIWVREEVEREIERREKQKRKKKQKQQMPTNQLDEDDLLLEGAFMSVKEFSARDDRTDASKDSKSTVKYKTNKAFDIDDQLDAAWAETKRNQALKKSGFKREIETVSSEKENDDEYIPNFKLSARSLSSNRESFRNSPSRRRSELVE